MQLQKNKKWMLSILCNKFIYILECFFLSITSSKFHQIATAIFKNIRLVLTKNNLFKIQSNLMPKTLVSFPIKPNFSNAIQITIVCSFYQIPFVKHFTITAYLTKTVFLSPINPPSDSPFPSTGSFHLDTLLGQFLLLP